MENHNKLIAEFMGYKYESWVHLGGTASRFFNTTNRDDSFPHAKYDKSYDWLMPVIEKISRLRIGDGKTYVDYAYPRTFGMLNEDGSDHMMVRLNGFCLHQDVSLLKAAYSAVIEFIKHYNEMGKSTIDNDPFKADREEYDGLTAPIVGE